MSTRAFGDDQMRNYLAEALAEASSTEFAAGPQNGPPIVETSAEVR